MNKRNWFALFLIGVFAVTSFQSCKKDEEDTTTGGDTGPTEWTRSPVFPEDARNGAASFVLGNEAYLIGGYHQHQNTRFDDVWSFDGSQWVAKSDFPDARYNAVGFSIDGIGYVGLGYDGTDALDDFYSYDPATGDWSAPGDIAPFPGEARFGAVAFSVGGNGYVGLGSSPTKTFSDFYKYDPDANTWTSVPTPFTYKKAYAFSFVIGNKAYVGGGISNNQLAEDFYSFDGTTWTKLRDLTRQDSEHTYDVRRHSAGAFTIGSYGYIVSGRGLTGVVGNVWKYDPSADTWTGQHQAIQGTAREKAVSFAIGGNGYIATGSNGSVFLDDNLKFVPVR